MIAKVKSGRAFTGLARYLETGREGSNPDRVAWTEARNLPTNDPHTASLIMRATAAQSVRTEKPVYHIALSFDPDDAVDRATMVQVADRLTRDLRLQEHQALIVAHGDTRHPHLHIMINRVHPETFRAWDPKHDYAQIERSLREQERELNLRAVPGRHRSDGHEQTGRSAENRSTGKAPNPSREMDHKQEDRPRDQRAAAPEPSATDIAAARARVEAPQDYPAARGPHDRTAPTPNRSAADLAGRRTASAGQDASAAGRSHEIDADRPHRANGGHEDTRQSNRRALDPRLDRVRQTIDHLDQRIQLERARDRAGDDLDRARVRLIPFSAQRAQARQTSKQFRSALSEVYRDPVAARRAFHTRAERTGAAAAAAELGHHPQRFGELRGTQLGPVRSAERTTALQAAPKLEHLGSEHVRRVREAWANRGEYRQARATIVHLERHIKTLDGELERGPRRAQLEKRLGQELAGLQPRQQQMLNRSLPIPHRKLLTAANTMLREFARQQGHER